MASDMLSVVALLPLLLFAQLRPAEPAPTRTIYVAPNGSDVAGSGQSPLTALASCAGAVRALNAHRDLAGADAGGVEILFLEGTYPLTANTTCGTVSLEATEDEPIVFRGEAPGSVVFDATGAIDASGLRPISNTSVAALINPAAKGKVLELPIAAGAGWAGQGQLEWNGVPLTASVWPNKGLGYVRRVFDAGAVYAEGRTKGDRPRCHVCQGTNTSTSQAPCGANISLAEQPLGDWAAEMAAGPGFGGLTVSGYLANDWYAETHRVAKVVRSRRNTSLQFASYSRYGICEALEGSCQPAPGRFTVSGLLSEVDTPGEYYYNAATSTLYVYPPATEQHDRDQRDHEQRDHEQRDHEQRTDAAATAGGGPGGAARPRLGFWQGPGLIVLSNATWVTLRDVVVSGSSGTAAAIMGGHHNTLGGNTFRNSKGGAALAGGYHNRVTGNDIYDVGSHISTTGNDADGYDNLRTTVNVVSNNHMTQVFLRGAAWQVRLSGMGDRFSHNLVHDAPGQLLLPGGPLSMLDHNEIFNTGYVEGDGGVVYAGASLTKGYGMQYRENFVHHSLEVPGLHGRGGIYFDDHEGSVSNCSGNVMYKAAGRSFLVNGGSSNNITHNLIVNGGVAIYNQHADDMTKDLPEYDDGELKRGDKGDYIWNTERALGVRNFSALFTTPLAKRWPTFGRLLAVNSTTQGWASPAGSNFRDNVFLNNSGGNICLLHHHGDEKCDGDLPYPGEPAFLDQGGSVEAEWAWFKGAADLEFVNRTLGFDTRTMGLRCDEFRRSLPLASLYRPWVRRFFNGVPSAADGDYTPTAAALRAGLESGRALVLNFTRPCPPLPKAQDCRAIWVAAGECSPGGGALAITNTTATMQVMRYTIEDEPTKGGVPCEFEDGLERARPCSVPT